MKPSVMFVNGAIRIRAETRTIACGGIMVRRFLAIALLGIGATFTHLKLRHFWVADDRDGGRYG